MQPENQPNPAAPFAAPAPPPAATTTPDPASGASPAAGSNDDALRGEVNELRALVSDLRDALSTRPATGGAPVSTAPAASPAAAAVAPGAPAHQLHTDMPDDVAAGDIVRFAVTPANGADPVSGYALVIDVVDVDDATGGTAGDGPSHREVVAARLDVMSVRLRGDQLVNEEASARAEALRTQQVQARG